MQSPRMWLVNVWTNHRKVSIAICIALVFCVIAIALFMYSSQNTPTQSGFGALQPNSHVVETTAYTARVPRDWLLGQGTIASGGTQDVITIPDATSLRAKIIIQGTPAARTPLTQIEGVFTAFGYTRSTFTIDNTTASRFIGSIPTKNLTLYEIAIVFQKRAIVYFVKLSYEGQSQNKALEDAFYEAASTFSFH